MNFGDLRTYVTDRYPTDLTSAQVNNHLNEVYKDLSALFTADTVKETTVSGGTVASQAEYTVSPSTEDVRRVREVHLDTGASRKRLKEVKLEALIYPRLSGTPVRWYPPGMTESGSNVKFQIGLDPVPTASSTTITVLYEPEPADLSLDADVPKYVTEEHHYLIAWGTMAIVAGRAQDYTVSQYWEARYRDAVNQLLKDVVTA